MEAVLTDVLFRGIRVDYLQEAATVVEQFCRQLPSDHKSCVTVFDLGKVSQRSYLVRRNGTRSISVNIEFGPKD